MKNRILINFFKKWKFVYTTDDAKIYSDIQLTEKQLNQIQNIIYDFTKNNNYFEPTYHIARGITYLLKNTINFVEVEFKKNKFFIKIHSK